MHLKTKVVFYDISVLIVFFSYANSFLSITKKIPHYKGLANQAIFLAVHSSTYSLYSLLGLVCLKFIYSVKATKFCEIFTLLLSHVVPVKSKVKISQNFVAFPEYVNFNAKTQTQKKEI